MPLNPVTAPQRTFWCFISYRHANNKEPGRQWATWLHQTLETYEVPSDLVGTTNERGDVIPERIYPVFRDEEELPVDADLASPIFRALDASKFLLVICSPRAVASNYVAQEIIYFKQLGREDRVLAAMIDGIPNVIHDPVQQARECFPAPLRHRVDAQGNLLKEIAEPVAADFRLDDATEGWCSPEAYRQELKSAGKLTNTQIEQRVATYQQRCELMKLKIVAGVLGIPLGTLTQRDKAYQLELSRKRARRLRQWLAAVAVLGIFAVAGAVIATQQARIAQEKTILAEQQAEIARQQTVIAQEQTVIAQEQTVVAEEQRTVAQKQTVIATENLTLARARLAETFYKEAARLIQGPPGAILPAVESLVSSLESAPDYGPSRRMLEHEMATREWVVPLAKYTAGGDILQAWLDPAGTQAMVLETNGQLHAVNLKDGQVISSADIGSKLPKGAEIITAACSASQQQIALLCKVNQKRTGDVELNWSWQLFVFLRDGTLVGSDPLASTNLDTSFYAAANERSDRLADAPLFFASDNLLLLMTQEEIIGWNGTTSAGALRYLGAQSLALPKPNELGENVFGWEYEPSNHSVRYMTNRQVIHQSIAEAKILQRSAFSQEPSDLFPSPDYFSGMVSFGAGTQAAVSGLAGVSFQMPEGIGFNLPAEINEIKEQYSKTFTSYDGVIQFTKTGGWMHFNDQRFDYSATNRSTDVKGKFQIAFPSNERATEWPPFIMRDFPDSVVLLSIVQSGSITPQLLEIISKPEGQEKSIEIPKHRGISQIMNGKTCWIAADGTKLAQIEGKNLILYRTSWRAKRNVSKAPSSATPPLSFNTFDLKQDDKAAPALKLQWDQSSSPASLKLEGKSYALPESLTPAQAVAEFSLKSQKVQLVVFEESKSIGNSDYEEPYEKRFRLWVINRENDSTYLSDWIFSFSVDRSEKRLATCNGTHVKIVGLVDGKEIQTFAPRRLSNHMTAPAQSVLFSYDSQVLGVRSLSSYQDYVVNYRAFDVETGHEYLVSRSGLTLWQFDLFPNPKTYQTQEWYDGPVPKQKIPFFVSGYERDFVNSLNSRPSANVIKTESTSKDPKLQWTILRWTEFSN